MNTRPDANGRSGSLRCVVSIFRQRHGRLVTIRLGRRFVGIELNPNYVEMARHRISANAPLLNVEAWPGAIA
jgi:hypothetical protein